METEQEPEARQSPRRARRAAGVIIVSALVIVVAGIAFLRPDLTLASVSSVASPARPPAEGSYQLMAVQFVTPATGWVAADLGGGEFAILNTTDGGRHWVSVLSGSTNGRGEYMHFFDTRRGLFILTGAEALAYSTSDGGHKWTRSLVLTAEPAYVLSAAYVDPSHGWLLVRGGGSHASVAGELLRTEDGGANWANLGSPVLSLDQVYRVKFADREHGWLDTRSAGPYLYQTADAGATWRRVQLPAPQNGWPREGEFFVAAEPTMGSGVVASVVNFPPLSGRSASGASVLVYPPLTVRAFDGGGAVTYTYTTFVDTTSGADLIPVQRELEPGRFEQAQPDGQVTLSSLNGGGSWKIIAPPVGAIGFYDASNWWWIGSGSWSTSSDGGGTWTPDRRIGVPAPMPGSLQVLDAMHAWFGAMAGARPILETTDDGGITWTMFLLPSVTP